MRPTEHHRRKIQTNCCRSTTISGMGSVATADSPVWEEAQGQSAESAVQVGCQQETRKSIDRRRPGTLCNVSTGHAVRQWYCR